jgi:TPR repeat protein
METLSYLLIACGIVMAIVAMVLPPDLSQYRLPIPPPPVNAHAYNVPAIVEEDYRLCKDLECRSRMPVEATQCTACGEDLSDTTANEVKQVAIELELLGAKIARLDGRREEAFDRYLELAEQGVPEAQFQVGTMYSGDQATEADRHQSRAWNQKAADNGHPGAYARIGFEHLRDLENSDETQEALRWLTAASDGGDAAGKVTLAMLYREGIGVEQDLDKAIALLLEVVHGTDEFAVLARRDLGTAYASKEDVIAAFAWIKLAFDDGLQDVRDEMVRLATLLSKSEFRESMALFRKLRAHIPLLSPNDGASSV